ncbi:MAG: DUF721 domain-containing protein, partial [Alphaproteobacteria bacterium]
TPPLWHESAMARKPENAAPPPQRSGRARAVADLVPAIGGQAFRKFGFTQSVLVERWEEVVGAQYARHSRPESLSFPRGEKANGNLKVAVTGALAPMLRHVEPQVIERVNRLLGYAAVARLTLRHADIEARPRAAPPAPPAELTPETRSTLRDIADPDLRASLESLARALSGSKGPPIVR